MRLLLEHVAEHSDDPRVQRYRRAIGFYAERLQPPYDK